jgi:hypothetical protein
MKAVYWLLLVLVVAGVTGCASHDEEDVSARPWNAPRNWETGLPSSMYERR